MDDAAVQGVVVGLITDGSLMTSPFPFGTVDPCGNFVGATPV